MEVDHDCVLVHWNNPLIELDLHMKKPRVYHALYEQYTWERIHRYAREPRYRAYPKKRWKSSGFWHAEVRYQTSLIHGIFSVLFDSYHNRSRIQMSLRLFICHYQFKHLKFYSKTV